MKTANTAFSHSAVAMIMAAMLVAGCTTSDTGNTLRPDLQKGPQGAESLNETLQREQAQPDGCLATGNAGNRSDRCAAVRDLLTPPALPEPVDMSPPPMPKAPPPPKAPAPPKAPS